MKTLEAKLSVLEETWDDPGDYPNALAQGPLPSYRYVEAIEGSLVVELETPDDSASFVELESGKLSDCELQDFNEDLAHLIQSHTPAEISISEWQVTREGDKITLEVAEFDADDYSFGEDRY